MVKFGETITLAQNSSPWRKYYFDYNTIKVILEEEQEHIKQQRLAQGGRKPSSSSWVSLTSSLRGSVSGLIRTTSTERYNDEHMPLTTTSHSMRSDYSQYDTMNQDEDNSTATNNSPIHIQQHFFHHDRHHSSNNHHRHHYFDMNNKLHPATAEFLHLLEVETEKVVLFFIEEQGKVAKELSELQTSFRRHFIGTTTSCSSSNNAEKEEEEDDECNNNATTNQEEQDEEEQQQQQLQKPIIQNIPLSVTEEQLNEFEKRYYDVGVHLLKLIQFVEVNVQGIRKILKKHDKLLPHFKLSTSYLKIQDPRNKNSSQIQQQQQQHHHPSAALFADGSQLQGSTITNHHHNRGSSRSSIIEAATTYGNQMLQPLIHDESLGSLVATLQGGVHALIYQQQQQQNHYYYYYYYSQQQQQEDVGITTSFLDSNKTLYKRSSTTGLHSSSGQGSMAARRSTSLRGVDDIQDIVPTKHQRSYTASPLFFSTKMVHKPYSSSITLQRKSFHDSKNDSSNYNNANINKLVPRPIHQHPEYVLLQIHAARRRLVQTNDFVKLLAAPFDIIRGDNDEEEDEKYDLQRTNDGVGDDTDSDDKIAASFIRKEMIGRTPKQQISDVLNLMSTFLFMTNYYIVAPTSSSYATKLGGNASLASMIIGMTPVAALVSTVLYSWWSSYSYKAALVFASSCSVIGSLLYAMGLPYRSINLVMMGRLLIGFGSARSINRRYIADVFSKEQRTAASAIFVIAGAMGMAAGPAIASLLHIVTSASTNSYWQSENSPGTLMFLVWSIYLGCLLWYFENPARKQQQPSKTKNEEIISTEQKEGHCIPEVVQATVVKDETTPLLNSGPKIYDNRITSTASVVVDDNGATTTASNPPRPKSDIVVNKKVLNADDDYDDEISIWENVPALMTFFIYFVLKLCLESVLSSTSVLAGFYFGWDGTVMGMYLAGLGLLMLPANLMVAHLAQTYDDRELITGMIIGMVVGCIGSIQYCTDPADYTLVQYITGSVILFVSATALEGPNMSLLSKTIPKSWRNGMFNVGLLATEAGTFGRVVTDIFLSVVGSHGGLEHLLNRTLCTFAGVTSLCLFLMLYFYEYMEPLDNDDA